MAVAAAAVNQFQTITHVVGINTVGIYTAPTGYTGVVLLAQVTNTDSVTKTCLLYTSNTTNKNKKKKH